MEGREKLLALEKILTPAMQHPVCPRANPSNRTLDISVVFTSIEPTLAAMKTAGSLATSLAARITLLATQVVPFPLQLQSPPVLLDWNEARFLELAGHSPVETVVRLYLCRDSVETLKAALPPKSLVVIGGRAGWWPFSREKRLVGTLRRAGHEVIFAPTE